MKKILFLTIGLIFSISINAQSPVMQGSILLDAGVGFPTGNILWDNGDLGENYTVNGGPFAFGGRFEYMLADDFGIGIDGNFVTTGYNYDAIDTFSVYDPVSDSFNDSIASNNYDLTTKRSRIMVRLNKHIVQNDQLDAYIGAGIGYKMVNRVSSTNGEVDAEQEEALIPVSFRLAFGARYFFTENLGAHIELGAWGGAPIQFGLALKF